RHTRSKRDWSSDVCSSDLRELAELRIPLERIKNTLSSGSVAFDGSTLYFTGMFKIPGTDGTTSSIPMSFVNMMSPVTGHYLGSRSEERRVGKECRGWWWWC